MAIPSETPGFIDEHRARIDEIDQQLIDLIKIRKGISRNIQQHRLGAGGTKSDISRENSILQKYREGIGDQQGVALAMKVLEICRG
ncbi:chorismate mutase [Streptomyces sp. NPDC054765]